MVMMTGVMPAMAVIVAGVVIVVVMIVSRRRLAQWAAPG
jgi:tetrahydromethanopterin S-methyltransferase subunit E